MERGRMGDRASHVQDMAAAQSGNAKAIEKIIKQMQAES